MTSTDELRRLLEAATPGPWAEVAESGEWWVEGAGGIGVCESNEAWNHLGDINLMIAAVNALPALITAVEAARRFGELGLPCEYTDEEPEPGGPDICPGVAEVGGPCPWCELRAALDAMEVR